MKRLLMIITVFTFALDAAAATSEITLQNKLNALRSMSAKFQQVVKVKTKIVSRSSGTMALERPGRFRWQTKEPLNQLMIADGKKIWIYDADLEQVTVKKQEKGLGGTAALFLSGYNDTITRDFIISQSSDGDNLTFDLQAKSSRPNFQRIRLTFKKDQLAALELFDQLGQITSVRLVQAKINPKLNASMFQFKVPQGVDVVQQ